MKPFKSKFQALTVAFALGTCVLGIVPATTLAATYDATAEFTFTLNNVVDLTGAQVTSGWDVTAIGYGDALLDDFGDATASGNVSIIDPAFSFSIGDSIIQTSTSSGEAIDGFASTDALTDLSISFENFLAQTLIFSFEYDIYLDTLSTGDANASAAVDMLDDLGFLDIQAFSDALSGPEATDSDNNTAILHGSAQFELSGGDFNYISGYIDTFGSAYAEAVNAPEPLTLLLFATGLVGIGVVRYSKKQA